MTESYVVAIVGACIGFLQALIVLILLQQSAKMKKICEDNIAAHRDLWKRIYGHFHTENGDVIVPHEVAG